MAFEVALPFAVSVFIDRKDSFQPMLTAMSFDASSSSPPPGGVQAVSTSAAAATEAPAARQRLFTFSPCCLRACHPRACTPRRSRLPITVPLPAHPELALSLSCLSLELPQSQFTHDCDRVHILSKIPNRYRFEPKRMVTVCPVS